MKFSTAKLATALSLTAYGLMALPTSVMADTPIGGGAPEGGIDVGTIESSTGFASNLGSVITTVLSVVMGIAALAVFMYLIMGGIQWITSGGEKGKTEEARNKITSAVIGLIVLAASYALLLLLLKILGFDNLTDALSGIKQVTTTTGNL